MVDAYLGGFTSRICLPGVALYLADDPSFLGNAVSSIIHALRTQGDHHGRDDEISRLLLNLTARLCVESETASILFFEQNIIQIVDDLFSGDTIERRCACCRVLGALAVHTPARDIAKFLCATKDPTVAIPKYLQGSVHASCNALEGEVLRFPMFPVAEDPGFAHLRGQITTPAPHVETILVKLEAMLTKKFTSLFTDKNWRILILIIE